MANSEKSKQLLEILTDIDTDATRFFRSYVERKFLPYDVFRSYYVHLETSCNGFLWTFGVYALLLFSLAAHVQALLLNIALGLFFDFVLSFTVKYLVRRRRPCENKDDKAIRTLLENFSFPSGHSVLAVFLASYFIHACDLGFGFAFLLSIWAAAVCVSRILLGRHYILDVLCGAVLGYVIYVLTCLFEINEHTASAFMNWYFGICSSFFKLIV